MRYKAFLNRQEIAEFPVENVGTNEIWGGNTLLWKKQRAKIRRNIANFVVSDKAVNKNGIEVGDILEERTNDSTKYDYFAIFTGEGSLIQKLAIPAMSAYNVPLLVSFGEYFYAICIDGYIKRNYEKVTAFYKFSEKGELIFKYTNSKSIPDRSGQRPILHGFYVGNNDIFYILVDHPKDGYKIHEYRNGVLLDSYTIYSEKEEYFGFISTWACKSGFIINGEHYFEAEWHTISKLNSRYIVKPLLKMTPDSIVPISIEYNYLGTNGKQIFFTGVKKSDEGRWGNDSKIYLYENNRFKLVYNGAEDEGEEWQNRAFVRIAFIENIMFVLVSDYMVIRINTKTYSKATTIYELIEREGRDRYWESYISQVTTKNGKLYVHKVTQRYANSNSYCYVDEVTF